MGSELSSADSRLIGELSADMKHVIASIEDMRKQMLSATVTCNEFKRCQEEHRKYQEERKAMPEEIADLKRVAEDYMKMKPLIEKACAQNEYLKMLLGVLWLVVGALIGLIQQGYLRVQI